MKTKEHNTQPSENIMETFKAGLDKKKWLSTYSVELDQETINQWTRQIGPKWLQRRAGDPFGNCW